jgi:hypothetical protein
MLSPFIIIGVGGSGGKTLRAIRYELELRLQAAGWDGTFPEAWQFLHFDTPVKQDGAEYPAPFLPAESYRGLVAASATYSTVAASITAKANKASLDHVARQLPDPSKVAIPIVAGAGQYRGVGRAIVLSRLDDVAAAANNAIQRLKSPSSLANLELLGQKLGVEKAGMDPNPVFLVISSIAGGSGAGQYIDVTEAIKARFNEPWVDESYGILFAPDVFDGIKGGAGIPANALATVSETVSGFWNRYPHSSVQDMFSARGLSIQGGGANDRIGVRYPFIVGRQGANTSFGGQNDVYKAVSATITAWMTDDKFQDSIAAYSRTNWLKNTARNVLPENSGLLQDDHVSPALSAIGFGRVTLAREKFIEYSAEKLAKSSIEKLLRAHTEEDPRFERMDEAEWIRHNAEKAQIAFIRASGLNEETEEHDEVINALRDTDNLKAIQLEFKSVARSKIAAPGSLDKNNGLPVDDWYNRMLTVRGQLAANYLDQDLKNRQHKLDEWIAQAPEVLLKTVARFSVQQGLRVTGKLLEGLAASLERAAKQLESESLTFKGYVDNLGGYVYEALQTAAASPSVREDHEAVEAALGHIESSIYWESEASLRASAARLVTEVRKELVKPLEIFINSAYQALSSRVNADETAEGRPNEYPFWPDRLSKSVSKKYQPSSNEKMLLEIDEFTGEFERLIVSSTDKARYDDAVVEVMSEMLEELNGKAFLQIRKSWRPVATADPNLVGANGSNPTFEMPDSPEQYVGIAKLWMKRKGTPFQVFIETTLSEYFDKSKLGPEEYNKRKDRFLSHLRAAFNSATPLIKINAELLSTIHEKQISEGDSVIVSAIPFNNKDDMYEPTFQVLLGEMAKIKMPADFDAKNEISRWFREQNADSIEFFTMLGYPVNPMTIDSIMQPVASAWSRQNQNASSREAFWRWIRARLLSESVPMDRTTFDRMIRGWFVAQALGLLEVETNAQLGPKVSISARSGAKLSFPHPLLYSGTPSSNDLLAAVIESSIIVQALCSAASSLDPLKPYQRLIELGGMSGGVGGVETSLSQDLKCLLATGERIVAGDDRTEFPATDLASVNERKAKLNEYLEAELQEIKQWIATATSHGSVYSYPTTWEILSDIESAINGLNDLIASFTPVDGGGSIRKGVGF